MILNDCDDNIEASSMIIRQASCNLLESKEGTFILDTDVSTAERGILNPLLTVLPPFNRSAAIPVVANAGQNTFNEWILQIGNGELSNDFSNLSRDLIELPAHLVENNNLVASIFGDKISTTTSNEILEVSKKVILTPKNTFKLQSF